MDIVPTEGDESFLSGGFGLSNTKDITPSHLTPSDFEKSLFKDGVYHFDFDSEIRKSEGGYRSYQEWLRRAQPSNEKSSLADFIGSERHGLLWKQYFNEHIPLPWGTVWYEVQHDFKEAGVRGIQLSKGLVDAGISHSHHLVVNEAGKSQRLNPVQLGLVLGRDDIPGWNSSEVIEAQKVKGMTAQEFEKANAIAREIRAKIRRTKDKEKQLTSPQPQLKSRNQGGDV
jgi:hypothetical protein